MLSFRISVPGKVILFGEHSVVYGKTAVAASLNQRTSLDFYQLPEHESSISVVMNKIGLSINIPIDSAREYLNNSRETSTYEDPDRADAELARAREFVRDALEPETPQQQRNSLECLVYALMQVIGRTDTRLEIVPCRLEVDTELAINAGQGSSASFSVALVACFLRLARLQRDPGSPRFFSKDDRQLISDLAYNCERIMHGAPSGIDNSICTHGSIMEFRRGGPPEFVPMARKIKILMVDTRVSRSTKVLVDKLACLRNDYPRIIDPVLESMDEVAKQALLLIRDLQKLPPDDDDDNSLSNYYKQLSMLVDVNQGLLYACQVSHPSLNEICARAKSYELTAKLTGAGGGGFAYVLIPPNTLDDRVRALSSELSDRGYFVSETDLGGPGVEIHEAKT